MRTQAELAGATDPVRTYLRNLVRRMIVTLTGTASAARAVWQVTGHTLPGGVETTKAENFSGGIGLAARPPTSSKAEAIVLPLGDAGALVVVACRDQATRDAVASALKPNETMLHNTLGFVYLKDDGTIEARSKEGVAVALATLADVQALRATYNLHVHAVTGGPTAVPTQQAAAPVGTTKLKGE